MFSAEALFEWWRSSALWLPLFSLILFLFPQAKTSQSRSLEWGTVFCLLLIGVYLRVSDLRHFFAGYFTWEEIAEARVYTSRILSGESVGTGASELTYAWLLGGWYYLFGISTLSARAFSVVVGLLGLVFYFLSLKKLVGARWAAWSTSFLSLSAFGIYFSKMAFELCLAFLFGPLSLYLFLVWNEKKQFVWALLFAFVFFFSFFTYPGYLGGLIALGLSQGITQLFRPQRLNWGRQQGLVVFLWVCGFIVMALYHRHLRGAHNENPLFMGGASLTATWDQFLNNFQIYFKDIFLVASTWCLWLPEMPFVEWAVWPFVLVGVGRVFTLKKEGNWERALAICIPVLFIFLTLSGRAPGMRRGLFILLPIYFLAGGGAITLFERFHKGKFIFVMFLLAHFGFYQVRHLRAATSVSNTPPYLPDDFFFDSLQKYNLILLKEEASRQGAGEIYYDHLAKLAWRFGKVRGEKHRVELVSNKDSDLSQKLMQPNTVVLTWNAPTPNSELLNRLNLCSETWPSPFGTVPPLGPFVTKFRRC